MSTLKSLNSRKVIEPSGWKLVFFRAFPIAALSILLTSLGCSKLLPIAPGANQQNEQNTTPLKASSVPDLENVIYDQDDREEPFQASGANPLINDLARATVLLAEPQDKIFPLSEAWPFCESERFLDQSILGFCSGVLIAENKILTAGHCLNRINSCKDFDIILDYRLDRADQTPNPTKIKCSKITIRKNSALEDYAILELETPIRDRKAIEVAPLIAPLPANLISISYPLGLPAKVSIGTVREQTREPYSSAEKNYFKVEVDTFQGSSGSPIFDPATGKIFGVLSTGEEDFTEDDIMRAQMTGACLSTQICKKGQCRGERFFDVRSRLSESTNPQ